MTLLLRLLLLLWLVIGRGFGKVFLGNKSWKENANGGQSTIVCWKGTWAMFLAEPPLPVCPPHPPAPHTPVHIRHQTHDIPLFIHIRFYIRHISVQYFPSIYTCCSTTIHIKPHISPQLQPLVFVYPQSERWWINKSCHGGKRPRPLKVIFLQTEKIPAKVETESLNPHLETSQLSPWQSLSGRRPRRQRASACWSRGRGSDCRAKPAIHREALSFQF